MGNQKSYSMFKLLQISDFDALKTSKRFDTKEKYFDSLYNFTTEAERIIHAYSPQSFLTNSHNFNALAFEMDRLQSLLANIGAVTLTWEIEELGKFIVETKDYQSYSTGLTKVFSNIINLVMKLTDAEQPDIPGTKKAVKPIVNLEQPAATTQAPTYVMMQAQEVTPPIRLSAKAQVHIKKEDFEKLYMMIDNFEFANASHTIITMGENKYSLEINQLLNVLKGSLDRFDHDSAIKECEYLLSIIHRMQESSAPSLKRILAIDDMPDVLRTVKAMLRGKYTVIGMTEWNSALAFLGSNIADLILLDIEMPGMDGFSLLQLIRKLPDYQNVPVVFLTSNTTSENIKKP